jgi:hypothetical protein
MADLLSRLAERALGVAAVARPLTPPVFAPTPQVAVGALTPAPSSAIPPAHELRPEPEAPPHLSEAPPHVPKREQAPDAKVLPLGPWGKTPALRRPVEDAYPATQNQQLPSRAGEPSLPISPPDSRELDSGPLEKPVSQQRSGADATVSRSPMVASPSRETSAADPHARSMNPGGCDDEDARGKAATSVDAAVWRRPATPALLSESWPSARTAMQERELVRSHEQSDSMVQVNIGRIEVRAVFPQPPTSSPVRRAADSALSLADYLRERDRGAR